jgi:hypothetical protein
MCNMRQEKKRNGHCEGSRPERFRKYHHEELEEHEA